MTFYTTFKTGCHSNILSFKAGGAENTSPKVLIDSKNSCFWFEVTPRWSTK
jgi:hypothetical protein